MVRRILPGIVALGCTPLLVAFAEGVPSGQVPAASPGSIPLKLNEPVATHAESQGVVWRGNTYHLVRLGKAQFRLAEDARLTAAVPAGVTTFDNVDYTVHAAVYDGAGRLLGTAQAPVHVERVWLGKVLTESRDLKLDFGASNAYRDAKTFTIAISQRDVLTPDQWQK